MRASREANGSALSREDAPFATIGGSMSSPAASETRPGWITFSAVILFAVCFIRIISAINYFHHGIQINNLADTAFGNQLWVWGIWDLCLSVLAFLAGLSLLSGGRFGRILGYIWAIWIIVQSFMIISVVPWFAVTMIALAALVIYGLASTPEWTEASV
jgi:hypothetical protein